MKKKVDVENATIVARDDYVQVLEAIIAAGFCPFCEEHLFKHHRKPILFRSRYWLVTENSWPYKGSRFHFLFIARTHIEATENLTTAAWIDLYHLYQKVAHESCLLGGTLFIRSGDTNITGASVNHLHAHLVVGGKRTEGAEPITALVGFKK